MKAQELTGLGIVALEEADRLGTITEVLFAEQPLRIATLRANGDKGEFTIPFEAVRAIGRDAVTVETGDVARTEFKSSPAGGLIPMTALRDLKIVDDEGNHHGSVESVDVDERGHVVSLDAHKGGVLGVGGESERIDVDKVRTLSAELLTIKSA